jgi:hypothetical protein
MNGDQSNAVSAPASPSPFRKNGGGDSSFVPGGPVVPFAGGILGSNYHDCNHAVVVGSGLGRFLATFRGNTGRSTSWCVRGELLCAKRSRIRYLRICPGTTLCRTAYGPKRVSLWRRYPGDCRFDPARTLSVDCRIPSVCGGLHRNRRGADLLRGLAGTRRAPSRANAFTFSTEPCKQRLSGAHMRQLL